MNLPSRLAENLCRYLFNLKIYRDPEGKSHEKFDAIDSLSNKIEIKSTLGKDSSGSTTINPTSPYDILYWMNFDFKNDQLSIRKGNYSNIEPHYPKYSDEDGKKVVMDRVPVNLSDFKYLQECRLSLKQDEILTEI
ncbi:hypothetical protein RJG79_08140 [Mycoplasmatota bacterium WC44]